MHLAGDAPRSWPGGSSGEVYHQQTAPILPYYREKGILSTVDGMGAMDEVTRQIEAVIAG